jgi:cell wall-associated NlpC family hydrolase
MTSSKLRKTTVIICIALITLLNTQSFVSASPLSEKKARLSEIKNQLDSLDNRIEVADEEYLQASNKLGELKNKVYQTQIKLGITQIKLNNDKHILNTRANGMYKNGQMSLLDIVLNTKSFNEFFESLDFLNRVSKKDASIVKKVKKAKSDLSAAEKTLKTAKTEQQNTVNILYKKKKSIENDLAEKKKLMSGIEADIKKLEEEQRQAELRRIAEQNRITRQAPINLGTGIPTNAPNTGVVGIARQQLGKPYVWGAAGPNSFDCSGLMMYCYAQMGISLPHSSAAQIGSGQFVSQANLEPGDLVFFGSPIHHVGMYIGSGLMIHAPHSGDVVKVSSAFRGDYAGASRP